jgi:UDP-N-acetylglucosamine--N-acetylmuramyl-(pentapeptide) pyrophosphoryl-undecaprenol N-acetylglucosamine transferase
LKIPYIVHEANVIPGKANRFFAKHAKAVATHFSDSAVFFKVPVIETGMPIREEYCLNIMTKQQARTFFQLDPGKLTLFIFGGSQGAAAINRLFGETLPLTHEKEKNIQVLHFTGNRSSARELKLIYEKHGISAVVRDFETQMHIAWLAADLAISRAGASSIAEQIEMEVPGILIPYPYAGQHQDKNADWMVSNVKGVIKLSEKELTPQKLSAAIFDLISNEQKQLGEMKEAIRNYKDRRPAYDLLSLVCEIGK